MQSIKQRNQQDEEGEDIQSTSLNQNIYNTSQQVKKELSAKKQQHLGPVNGQSYGQQSLLRVDKQQANNQKGDCADQIKWNQYRITRRIVGKNYFGQIVLAEATFEQSTLKYVIKSLQVKFQRKRISKQQEEKKTAMLKQLKSNFVVKLVEKFQDQRYIYQVMEWLQGGDCFSFIKQKSSRVQDFKKAGECAVRFILGCIVLGMEQIHSNNIIYRGLMPQNILITQNGYAKLSNFSLAQAFIKGEKLNESAGMLFYMAPQMMLSKDYDQLIDLWDIGILAYQLSNYTPPFTSQQILDRLTIEQTIKDAQTNRVWNNPHTSQQLKLFINSLLKFEPQQRLGCKSWDEIKNHNFFTCVNFDWKTLEQMKMESPLIPIISSHKLKYELYTQSQQNSKGTAFPKTNKG